MATSDQPRTCSPRYTDEVIRLHKRLKEMCQNLDPAFVPASGLLMQTEEANLKRSIEILTEEKERVALKLKEKQKALERRQHEIDRLDAEIAEYTKYKGQSYVSPNDTREALTKKIEFVEHKIAQLRIRCDKYDRQISKLQEDLEVKKLEITLQRGKVACLETKLRGANKRCMELECSLKNKDLKLSAVEAEQEKFHQKYAALGALVNDLGALLCRHEQSVFNNSKLQEIIEVLQTEVTEHIGRVSALENALAESTGKQNELQRELADARQKSELAESSRRRLSQNNLQLLRELEILKKKNIEFQVFKQTVLNALTSPEGNDAGASSSNHIEISKKAPKKKKKKTFTCDACGRLCLSKPGLLSHVKTHRPKT